MARKRLIPSQQELLEEKLSELTSLIKGLAPEAQVEISFEQYEDEDASIDIHPPSTFSEEQIERIEIAFGGRCNDILLDTGLFIIGAVRD